MISNPPRHKIGEPVDFVAEISSQVERTLATVNATLMIAVNTQHTRFAGRYRILARSISVSNTGILIVSTISPLELSESDTR